MSTRPRLHLPFLRRLAALGALLSGWALPCLGHAQPLPCETGAVPCQRNTDCARVDPDWVCVDGETGGVCAPACPGQTASECALGETCVEGQSPLGELHSYCQASAFAIDINLVDSCIYHFVEGISPDLDDSADLCATQSRLERVLDRDDNGLFNIFDVDRCIKDLLDEEPCDVDARSCPGRQVFCTGDAQCGDGLYCNTDLHRCERQCGLVTDPLRDDVLERTCAGYLKVCDYERGRCVAADLTKRSCEVDRDCPSGAYCLAGGCEPMCFRSLQCPSDDWACGPDNRCAPKPRDPSPDAPPFSPTDYAVLLAEQRVALDDLNDHHDIPVLIMGKQTKRQVFDEPNVVFGYRLEVAYARKQSPECRGELTPELAEACLIRPEQEFITLDSPFGVLSADGDPSLGVQLNHRAAGLLGIGTYQATLTATFNNGSRSSATVTLQKHSLSGDYAGRMSVYLDHPDNLIGSGNVSMRLFLDRDAPELTWEALLAQNHIPVDQEFRDVTRGQPVRGLLHGNDSMLFNLPQALTPDDNELPVVGLYSESLNRLRLIGVVELGKDHCRSEQGPCRRPAAGQLQSPNPFDRPVRRIVEWVGPVDSAARRFEGMYRESIHGLLPHVVSLSGGFRLAQIRQDERPIQLAPLLPEVREVRFPALDGDAGLLSALERRIRTTCAGQPEATRHFRSRASYQAYLASAYDDPQRGPVLAQLVTFQDRVQKAIDNLSGGGEALTLADYFRGQIEFCDGQGGESCVDRDKLQCGLALYEKALLSGWVDTGLVGSEVAGDRAPALFCRQPAGQDELCTRGAREAPALVTLQEHNRFYGELTQTYSYEALNALSDAFYVMYKAQYGDALDGGAAFQVKQASLLHALENYQRATRAMVSPVGTAIMASWPMGEFASRGRSWIAQLHAAARDRMEAMTSLVDLRRRGLRDADARDALFAQHLMHTEFLQQVFLAALQQRWEGSEFAYEGQGPEMLTQGEVLLAKTKATRNPLGLHPGRVYFENSRLELSNWQALRERVREGNQQLQGTVNLAIDEMKRALHDKDSLLTSLLYEEQNIEQQLDELCGADLPLPDACEDAFEPVESACRGDDCLFQYRCGRDQSCDDVRAYYNREIREQTLLSDQEQIACRAGRRGAPLRVELPTRSSRAAEDGSVDLHGDQRMCARGRMGTLLMERDALEQQRRAVVRQVKTLVGQVARHQRHLSEVQTANDQLKTYLQDKADHLRSLEIKLEAAQAAERTAEAFLDPMGCMIIVGFAGGTDCPGRLGRAAARAALVGASSGAMAYLRVLMSDVERAKEIKYRDIETRKELAQLRINMDDLVAQVESSVAQYEQLTHQLFNVAVQIQDTHYLAERAVARYKERLGDLVDRLVGRESGSVLVRNGLIRDAERQFRKLLLDSYKMTQAFVHRYNQAEREHGLRNRVFQLSSARDIQAHLEYLTELEDRYCRAEGIDCDSVHNRKVFAYSIRKNLFPNLRDIVDPSTGSVLTAGQQFHNLLMGQMTRRRARPSGTRTQIEIPFHLWLNRGDSSGGRPQPYLINGEECNHILVADRANQSGTVAVNILGTRLRGSGDGGPQPITYELWRGGSDHIRSCKPPASRAESAINVYTVGWSPYHEFGQRDAPPSFQTHGIFQACTNDPLLSVPSRRDQANHCFSLFARDRSLAAPDWKLVIPFLDSEQRWLTGEGMPEHERPIISDIVLYFRYNARGIVFN